LGNLAGGKVLKERKKGGMISFSVKKKSSRLFFGAFRFAASKVARR
jgi:hypothetical protein